MRIAMHICIIFLVWVGLAAVSYFFGTLIFSNENYFRNLAENGRGAYATVTRTELENHGRVYYRYEVGGVEYEGAGSPGPDNPRNARPGDQLVIYYDPASPQTSIPSNPWDGLAAEQTGQFFVALTLPIFPMAVIIATYVVVTMSKRKRTQLAQNPL